MRWFYNGNEADILLFALGCGMETIEDPICYDLKMCSHGGEVVVRGFSYVQRGGVGVTALVGRYSPCA